jgi:hypothetical protein
MMRATILTSLAVSVAIVMPARATETSPHRVGDIAYTNGGGVFICPDVERLEQQRQWGTRKGSIKGDPAPCEYNLEIEEFTPFKIDYVGDSSFQTDRELGEKDICGTLADGRHFCTLSGSLYAKSDASWNKGLRDWLAAHGEGNR